MEDKDKMLFLQRGVRELDKQKAALCDKMTQLADGLCPWEWAEKHGMFQSTHPRGVRQNAVGIINSLKSFNPRTRVGCDSLDYLSGKIR